MSFHEQHSQNTSDLTQPATQQKTGWSTKKKVGVAVGSIVALAASFFAGTELGYYNARNDIAEHFANAFSEDSLNISATEEIQTNRTPTLQSTFPETLSVGESVEVPCSMYRLGDGSCMTIILTDIQSNAVCSSNYAEPGRYVALTFDASMPSNADSDFSSPFRSSPWSVVTSDRRVTQTRQDITCGEASYLDLLAEFPGYSASGTAWLPVPDNATEVRFDVSHEHLFSIPLG